MAGRGVPIYNLPLWREWRGLTQQQLARQAKVSLSALVLWEHGTANPRPRHVQQLARVLDVAEPILRTPDALVALTLARIADPPARSQMPGYHVRLRQLTRRLQQSRYRLRA